MNRCARVRSKEDLQSIAKRQRSLASLLSHELIEEVINIFVIYLLRQKLGSESLKELRCLGPSFCDAVDRNLQKLHLKTRRFAVDACDPTTVHRKWVSLLKLLKKFTALQTLILDDDSGQGWFSCQLLESTPRLKSLTFRKYHEIDRVLMMMIKSPILQLEEIVLDKTKGFTTYGLECIAQVKTLKRLSLLLRDEKPFVISPSSWKRFASLEELRLEIQPTPVRFWMNEICGIASLRKLELAMKLLPFEAETISGALQLKFLVVHDFDLLSQHQDHLSSLTQLSSLEIVRNGKDLPKWLRNFTQLKKLSITWNDIERTGTVCDGPLKDELMFLLRGHITDPNPGNIVEDILPTSLTELRLFGFKRLRRSIFNDLIHLKKLIVAYDPSDSKRSDHEESAFEKLTQLEELQIRHRGFQFNPHSNLPDFGHLNRLRKLRIECVLPLPEGYLDQILNLESLQDLTLAIHLEDVHLELVSWASSLKSLSLMLNPNISDFGFVRLCRLNQLEQFTAFNCGTLKDSWARLLKNNIPSLKRIGKYPNFDGDDDIHSQ